MKFCGEEKKEAEERKFARISAWDIFRRGYQAAPGCFRQLVEVLVIIIIIIINLFMCQSYIAEGMTPLLIK